VVRTGNNARVDHAGAALSSVQHAVSLIWLW
jgi:hypothetical protein